VRCGEPPSWGKHQGNWQGGSWGGHGSPVCPLPLNLPYGVVSVLCSLKQNWMLSKVLPNKSSNLRTGLWSLKNSSNDQGKIFLINRLVVLSKRREYKHCLSLCPSTFKFISVCCPCSGSHVSTVSLYQ
jgi:hypothetical protein